MDTLTHALFSFLPGQAAKKDKESCAAHLLGGIAPDFYIGFLFIMLFFPSFYYSLPASLLLVHRGITHSIIFGIATSWIFLYAASRKPVSKVD